MWRFPPSPRIFTPRPSFSVWIVNGYQLAITISLLPLASLGEIIGYRRVYLVGLLLFTVASLCCALSHTLVLLTASRVLQGFGAAGIMSVNAALVRFTYPRAKLGHGIGINALGGGGVGGGGTDLGGGHPVGGNLALAFRHQYPLRHRRSGCRAPASCRIRPRRPIPSTGGARFLRAVTFGLGIAAIDSVGHGERPLLYCQRIHRSRSSPA